MRLVNILLIFFLTACTSSTEFGKCIGVDTIGKEELEYKISIKNSVIALLFAETIIVPIIVISDEIYCPIARKEV